MLKISRSLTVLAGTQGKSHTPKGHKAWDRTEDNEKFSGKRARKIKNFEILFFKSEICRSAAHARFKMQCILLFLAAARIFDKSVNASPRQDQMETCRLTLLLYK